MRPQSTTKVCRRCGVEQPLTAFSKTLSGHRNICKSCDKIYDAARYRSRTPEQRVAEQARQAQWRADNREYLCERSRDYRRDHLVKAVETNRRWREKNRSADRASNARRRVANRIRYRSYKAKWRALRVAATVGYVSYEAIWERDQGMCYLCNQPVERTNCHFDHVIPLSRGGEHSMENIRVTHAVCNVTKKDRMLDELA
jgi:hypothetical protein